MAGPVVTAKLLNASGLHWVVQLSGQIEAVVEYDARRTGVEVVKVDSRVVCREGTMWGYNGHFAFTLPNHGNTTRAELEIRTSLWSAVTEFRLRLNGSTVFVCESDIDTCSLPVPARSPASSRAELPLPHPG